MTIRNAMRASAAPYLQQGEEIQAVIGAQTASHYIAMIGGVLPFLGLNRYRIVVFTPQRILVLDAGKMNMKKARSITAELPRSAAIGDPSGLWHVIPVEGEKLHVHRRFFKDIQLAAAA